MKSGTVTSQPEGEHLSAHLLWVHRTQRFGSNSWGDEQREGHLGGTVKMPDVCVLSVLKDGLAGRKSLLSQPGSTVTFLIGVSLF